MKCGTLGAIRLDPYRDDYELYIDSDVGPTDRSSVGNLRALKNLSASMRWQKRLILRHDRAVVFTAWCPSLTVQIKDPA